VKPQRNPQYLAWIRTLPCIVCGLDRSIEASHTDPNGLGQKSSDYSAIPLCIRHHRTGKDSYHKLGPRKFSELHNVDIRAIVGRLNMKPMVRLEEGSFVAHLEGEHMYLEGSAADSRRPSAGCGRCADVNGWQ
jgi:hypothetical protein